ncbi:MAG: hypothetical protein ABIF19_05350 [Planctomycetota bacterium]
MKRPGTTTVFVIACIAVLIGAYLAGICIRGVRFRGAGVEAEPASVVDKIAAEPVSARAEAKPTPSPENEEQGEAPTAEEAGGSGGDRAARMRGRSEGMSDEDRAKMRERFAGRRREGGPQAPQLSEEDREKMRAEMDELRARWEEMSEEERQEATAQMREKYGFAPRMGGPGGGRSPGGRSDAVRQENN